MKRPNVSFVDLSRLGSVAKCLKDQDKSDSHLPGISTVQCLYSYPKFIRLSVIDRYEGANTSMSIFLSRFKYLPRAVYYDNGCKLSKSVPLLFS